MKMGLGHLKFPGKANTYIDFAQFFLLMFCFSYFCQTKKGGTRKEKKKAQFYEAFQLVPLRRGS